MVVSSAASTPGTFLLGGNVLMSGTSGAILTTAVIGAGNAGILDLGGASRTFSVPQSDGLLNVSTRITNGGITKNGLGMLCLNPPLTA
jgi:hypothetical protein